MVDVKLTASSFGDDGRPCWYTKTLEMAEVPPKGTEIETELPDGDGFVEIDGRRRRKDGSYEFTCSWGGTGYFPSSWDRAEWEAAGWAQKQRVELSADQASSVIEEARRAGKWPPPAEAVNALPLDERLKLHRAPVLQDGVLWHGYDHCPIEHVLPPATIWANGKSYDPRPVYAAVRAAGFSASDEDLINSLTRGDGLCWHNRDVHVCVHFSTIYAPMETTPRKVGGYIVSRNRDRFGPYTNPADVANKLREIMPYR